MLLQKGPGESGESGEFDEIFLNVATNANELARRALTKVANPANLTKCCQMLPQMQMSLLEEPWRKWRVQRNLAKMFSQMQMSLLKGPWRKWRIRRI